MYRQTIIQLATTLAVLGSAIFTNAHAQSNSSGELSSFDINSSSTQISFAHNTTPVLDSWAAGRLTENLVSDVDFRNLLRSVPVSDHSPAPTRAISESPTEIPARNMLSPIMVDDQVKPASFVEANGLRDNDAEGDGESEGDSESSKTEKLPKAETNSALVEVTEDDIGKKIEEQKKLITENDSLDESDKSAYLEQLNSASTWHQKAKNFRSNIEDLETKIANFDRDMAEQTKRLEAMSVDREIDPEATSDQLQSQLQEKRSELQEAKSKLAAVMSQLEKRETLTGQIPVKRNEALERVKKIEQGFTALADKPNDLAKQLSELALEAQKLATKNEIEALDIEVRRQEQVGKLLPIERDVLAKTVNRLEKEIEAWDAAFGKAREAEIEREKTEAKRIAMEAIKANPGLAELANRNKTLLVDRQALTEKIQDARAELQQVGVRQDDVDSKFKSLKQKIEKGMTTANGMLLVEHRQDLMQPMRSKVRINEITKEIQEVKLKEATLKEQREPLSNVEEFVKKLAAKHGLKREDVQQEEDDQKEVERKKENNKKYDDFIQMANELVTSQLEYIDNLDSDYDGYRTLLINVASENSLLVTKVNESRQYIDQNAIWLKSSSPVNVTTDFAKSQNGMFRFFSYEAWSNLAGQIKGRAISKPLESGLTAVVLIGIFIFNRRLKERHA